MKTLIKTCLLASSLCLAAACTKKPPPAAKAALVAALSAVEHGNAAGFIAKLVPAQRAGARSLRQWPFFAAIKSHSIDDEFSKMSDGAADFTSQVYFDAAQKVFTTLTFEMKNAGGAWQLDLKETIRLQIATNGAAAFNKYKFVHR